MTPYAFYMKANNAFEQIVDVGRDQLVTNQAQALLGEVIKRYPNSEYALDARQKLAMVNDQLAGKEMEIGRYYINDRQPLAAIGRFKTVVVQFQTTSHIPEALYRLVEANLTMGLVDEATRNAAVLGFNYPGDRWYKAAYDLLALRGAAPDVKPDAKGKHGPDVLKPERKNWLSRIIPI
jgi:outer membrane protein assembly factor BamD